MKIKGLDALVKKTDEMAKFARDVDGELASVSFDPQSPASIEAAIQTLNEAIDAKAIPYARNDWIQNLVHQLKENARDKVLEKAAAARMGSSD